MTWPIPRRHHECGPTHEATKTAKRQAPCCLTFGLPDGRHSTGIEYGLGRVRRVTRLDDFRQVVRAIGGEALKLPGTEDRQIFPAVLL